MPGGADLPYCATLNGAGNRIISRYVRNGGKYVGFCAGGYYATKRVIWEAGNHDMEVVGDRELQFFPGTGRGCAFDGFKYGSEIGMRAVKLDVKPGALECDVIGCMSYYNGGGVFLPDQNASGFEVLATYGERTQCDPSGLDAAIVLCKVGEGAALLTGPHPEFAPELLRPDTSIPGHADQVRKLQENTESRMTVLRACLEKLGMKGCSEKAMNVYSLSTMHLTSSSLEDAVALEMELGKLVQDISSLDYQRSSSGQSSTIKAEADTFVLSIDRAAAGSSNVLSRSLVNDLPSALSIDSEKDAWKLAAEKESAIPDFSDIPKHVLLHASKRLPTPNETPSWDHRRYLNSIKQKKGLKMGSPLLYAEVTTSTNTLLVSNPTLLRALPDGTVFVASNQIAGRGRGNNVWVSPPGCLMFSLVIQYPVRPSTTAGSGTVVFIQYLTGMAVLDAVKRYGKGYQDLEVRLKWPNDIYARPSGAPSANDSNSREGFVKIGGILVQSIFSSPESFNLVIGVGLNVSNPAPTASLDSLAASCNDHTRSGRSSLHDQPLTPFVPEELLPQILNSFQDLYGMFLEHGWNKHLEQSYYKAWLHNDQIISLQEEGGIQARIRGVSHDWGMLVVEEQGLGSGRPTGRRFEVTSDGNSFDYMRGLVRRKQ